MNKKPKCLILGDKGLIGNCMVKKLIQNKYPVITDSTRIDNNFTIPNDLNIKWVFNLAGTTGGIQYIKGHEQEIIQNNLTIDKIVLEQSIKAGVEKLFHASSACVYPQHLQGNNYRILNEEDSWPIAPDTLYGLEKIFMEKYYLSFSDKIDVRIGRFFAVFGQESLFRGGKEKFIPAICRKIIQSNGEMEVFGTGENIRDSIYVEDAVDAVLQFMESNHKNEIINISDRPITIMDTIQYLVKYSRKDIKVNKNLNVDTGVNNRVADLSKLKSLLNFKPKIGLYEGLERTYRFIEEELNI